MRVLRIQSKYLKVTIYDNDNNSDIKNEDGDYNDDDNDGDYNYKKDNNEKLNFDVIEKMRVWKKQISIILDAIYNVASINDNNE